LLFQQLGYSPQQIRALGGGATQFSVSAGTAALSVHQVDTGLFVADNWRLRPNLTLSYGLRYEWQTHVHDWRDLGPRLSVAWAPGGSTRRKTVLRAGFGMFYDRFALAHTLSAARYNGVVQQQYVIANPDTFPNAPAASTLGSEPGQLVQRIASDLRAPYILQSAVTVERQLFPGVTLAVTYTNSRGLHLLRSRDVNAPLPVTPGVFSSGPTGSGVPHRVVRPLQPESGDRQPQRQAQCGPLSIRLLRSQSREKRYGRREYVSSESLPLHGRVRSGGE